jgi:hypothetical protein
MRARPSLLRRKLEALRPYFARAAQKVVDAWEQNEDGEDEELGEGGVCDRVADALGTVIAATIPNVELTDGGHEGDDHAFVIVYSDAEAFSVDIPPGVYEVGGGYRWKKRAGAHIGPEDIAIDPIPRHYLGDPR